MPTLAPQSLRSTALQPTGLRPLALGAGGGAPLLLDLYSGGEAGLSLRLLTSAWAANDILIARRASDNLELGIGSSGNDLDEAALLAHGAGTDWFYPQICDQNGNGNHATQSTAGNQPQGGTSGSIIYENGKPCASMPSGGKNYVMTPSVSASDYSFFFVANSASDSANQYIFDTFTGRIVITAYSSFGSYNFDGNWEGPANLMTSGQKLVSFFLVDPSSGAVYRNKTLVASGLTYSQRALGGTTRLLSGYTNAVTVYGTFQEALIYASDQTSNRTGIEANISAYWGTP